MAMRTMIAITNGSRTCAPRKPLLFSERLRQLLARRQDCWPRCPQSDAGARGPQEDSAARSALCGSHPGGQASSLLFLPDNALLRGEASLASARPGDHAVLIQHGTAVNGTCYVSDPHRFVWTARTIFKAVSRYILGNTFIRKDACQMMNQTALVKWNCVTSTQAF